MNTARSPRRIRTISALILTIGGATVLFTGCSSTSSVDGTYIKVADTSGISSAWIVEGDSIQYVNGSCSQYDLENEPSALSEDHLRITDATSGDIYHLDWHEDGSGFVWEDHGDFIRDDSEVGKSAVERWEAACGMEWLG